MSKTIYELVEDIDRRTLWLVNNQDDGIKQAELIDRLRTRLQIANGLLQSVDSILQCSEVVNECHNDSLHDLIDRTDRLYDEYLNLAPL